MPQWCATWETALLKPVVSHPCSPRRKLFLAFDQCHIIKNVRSLSLEGDITGGSFPITGQFVKDLYELQKKWSHQACSFLDTETCGAIQLWKNARWQSRGNVFQRGNCCTVIFERVANIQWLSKRFQGLRCHHIFRESYAEMVCNQQCVKQNCSRSPKRCEQDTVLLLCNGMNVWFGSYTSFRSILRLCMTLAKGTKRSSSSEQKTTKLWHSPASQLYFVWGTLWTVATSTSWPEICPETWLGCFSAPCDRWQEETTA